MKRLLIIAAVLLMSQSVSAEKLIVTYNKDNVLSGVDFYREGEKYQSEEGDRLFIYDMDTGLRTDYVTSEPEEEKTPGDVPEAPPAEESEEEEPATAYENAKDAISAFAIVTGKSQVLQNDEEVWKIDVLYQGKERELYVPDETPISTVPDCMGDLSGCTVSALRRGDVINLSAYLSGKIKEIGLIMRIGERDIVTGGIEYGYDFESLYSAGGTIKWSNERYPIHHFGKSSNARVQYQFGLVHAKRDMYYTITNKAGRQEEIVDIPILPETVVYICDVGKKYEVSRGSRADILASFIPSASFDDDGNIVSWDSEGEYYYALSRTVDGIATDVVWFCGLK